MYLPPGQEPHAITILLLERFAMIAFASTVEPLREANWVAGRRVFEWKVVSHDGQPVRASNGLALQVDGSISDVPDASTVIVCSSFDPHLYTTPPIIAWLRRLDRRGAYVGAVETGAYVLARAGLLDQCRATIHWENNEGMMRQFPKVQLTGRIFEVDGRRFSAAGAAAAMDMMLHLISTCVGREIALGVAEEFIYNRMRPAKVPQRLPASERLGATKPRLKRLLSRLDADVDERLEWPRWRPLKASLNGKCAGCFKMTWRSLRRPITAACGYKKRGRFCSRRICRSLRWRCVSASPQALTLAGLFAGSSVSARPKTVTTTEHF